LYFKARLIGKDGTAWNKTQSFNLYKPTDDFAPKLLPVTSNLNNITELFNYFICDRIVEKIVYSTNKRLSPITTKVEVRAFIGILLLLGVTKKQDIEINEIYRLNSVHYLDWVVVCMSRNRLKDICRTITFDDIDTRLDESRRRSSPKFFKFIEVFEIFKANLVNG